MNLVVDCVTGRADIVRARRVLAETYRRLTDYASPRCVLMQIAEQIDALEAWIANQEPHL